jgi:hypothetical protein
VNTGIGLRVEESFEVEYYSRGMLRVEDGGPAYARRRGGISVNAGLVGPISIWMMPLTLTAGKLLYNSIQSAILHDLIGQFSQLN